MTARLRSWWQRVRKPLEIFVVVAGCIVVIALLVVIAQAYIFNVDVPGLHGKTLWDWLQLLIIPLVLAVGGFWLSQMQKTIEQRSTTDNQRETALQGYIDKMSELLLEKSLRESRPEDEVCMIARVRTLTLLPRLDARRKKSVLQFLYESHLIDKHKQIVDLSGADLSGANLRGTVLRGADLKQSNLCEADLREANLEEANLNTANLHKANAGLLYSSLAMHGYADPGGTQLSRADLGGADLSAADLRRANLSEASMSSTNLAKADLSQAFLRNANLETAVLVETNLTGAFLDNANLNGVNLSKANLRRASLTGSTLTGSMSWLIVSPETTPELERLSRGADLSEADLSGADLSEADLSGAYLKDSIVTLEQLEKAKSLKGATMPDGEIHP